jgi:hypothetical protein
MNIDQLVRDADPAALITIPDPPHVGAIMALGRASQRRRRRQLAAGITAGTAAAAMVLGLGLTGVFGPVPARGTGAIRTTAPARGTGTIRTTAFTLVKHANGTVTLTINLFVVLRPGTLQGDLRQDGIPAIVTAGSFCSSASAPAGINQAVTTTGPKGSRTMTINPSAMPAGTELSFGYFQLASAGGTGRPGQEAVIELIDTSSYTCTSTAPATPGLGQPGQPSHGQPSGGGGDRFVVVNIPDGPK